MSESVSMTKSNNSKAARHAERIKTVWEIATYDVWGNERDGFEVNDVYRKGEIELTLTVRVNNAGSPSEFRSAHPSDKQLRQLFGVRCQLSTDGDDLSICVNRERDCYPIGELRCVSHESLSPIRPGETV